MVRAVGVDEYLYGFLRDVPDGLVKALGAFIGAARVDENYTF